MRKKIYSFIYGLMQDKVLWNDAVEKASFEFDLDKDFIVSEYREERKRKEYLKKAKRKGIQYTLTCRDCGKVFDRWGRNCILCKECSAINKANHGKTSSKKFREEHPEKIRDYQKKHRIELMGFSSFEEYEEHQRQKEIESQIQKIFKECDRLLRKFHVRTCVVCGCKFYKGNATLYCSRKCSEKAKEQKKKERRHNNPEAAEKRREWQRQYISTHEEVKDKIKSKARHRWNSMPMERRNEINARRRERRWKSGARKANAPDLPINKVYIHTFPNGKVYVGITKNTELRWDNGEGYIDNKPMYNDIKRFGWDNIKHEVIADGLLRDEANRLETQYIFMLDSTNPIKGYNRTSCSKVC